MADAPDDIRIHAFIGDRCVAAGDVVEAARAAKAALDRSPGAFVRLFDDRTGRRLDLDFAGSEAEVAGRAEWLSADLAERGGAGTAPAVRGRGRPKLGVVAREVTLLPRHWAWLDSQRGNASATLRRLVDEARNVGQGAERARHAQDAAYRFMHDAAGDAPGYQDAIRSLYRGDAAGFGAATDAWPDDVRDYARALAADAFAVDTEA